MSTHAALRAATAAEHDLVDAAFGRFDLAHPADYCGFLTAHARALPAVEEALMPMAAVLPPLRPRAPLLMADLAVLEIAPPPLLPVAAPTDAATAFGMAYVIEGSRLGGGLLARSIGEGLPRAYLFATHLPGEWRAFSQAIDRAGEAGGEAWVARAIAAARETFALYGRAAAA